MTCQGGKSRITQTRPHLICRTCQRFTYAADSSAPDYIQPALIDSDGVATCPNRHAATLGASPANAYPHVQCVGGNTGGAL